MNFGDWCINALADQLGIKSKNKGRNMNEEQHKCIEKTLNDKLKTLLSCKENRVQQAAIIGYDLKEILEEIKEIENALEGLSDDKDINERESEE